MRSLRIKHFIWSHYWRPKKGRLTDILTLSGREEVDTIWRQWSKLFGMEGMMGWETELVVLEIIVTRLEQWEPNSETALKTPYVFQDHAGIWMLHSNRYFTLLMCWGDLYGCFRIRMMTRCSLFWDLPMLHFKNKILISNWHVVDSWFGGWCLGHNILIFSEKNILIWRMWEKNVQQ